MKIIYNGTGHARIVAADHKPIGEVASGHTIDCPDKLAKALLKQDPNQWSEDRPSPRKPRGGS